MAWLTLLCHTCLDITIFVLVCDMLVEMPKLDSTSAVCSSVNKHRAVMAQDMASHFVQVPNNSRHARAGRCCTASCHLCLQPQL